MLGCRHLKEIKLSYFSHAQRTGKFALWAVGMSVVCIIHGFLPWVFTDTFSYSVLRLAEKLDKEKRSHEKFEDWF